ncbi:MAG: hypothetical protein KF845_01150 [Cyclobacteriaceae bacterium]|nr:hypothetical protein [Cyclobacteriaceae bacterium]
MIHLFIIVITVAASALVIYLFRQFESLQKSNAELNHALAKANNSTVHERNRNKLHEASLQEQLKKNEELLKSERKRIAADLHDDIVQRMVVVRFRLEQLLYYPLPKRAEDEVKLLHRDMERIMGDIRYLIDDLVQPKFEIQTFTELVKNLFNKLSRMLHLKTEFTVRFEENEFPIPPHVKRELYYIIQEAAQNSLNHSVALILEITVSWQNGLMVIVKDDGQGLPLLGRGRGRGHGMASIQQRAEAIGADLTIRNKFPGLIIILEYENSQ